MIKVGAATRRTEERSGIRGPGSILGVVRNTSGDIPAPEWRIYTNVHASGDWQAKEVILKTSNETVGALLPGDSLAIWAGARCVLRLSTIMTFDLLLINQGFRDG